MYEKLLKRLRNGLSCYGEKCLSCRDREHCTTLYDHDAADAIEELSKPRWISVKERLPENRTKCVTISKDGDYGLGLYITDMGWIFPYYMGKTTHWMPLPDPQKEES